MHKLIYKLKKDKIKAAVLGLLAALILIIVLAYVFAVRISFLPLPAAYAGKGFVTLNQYNRQLDLADRSGIALNPEVKENILQKLIDSKIERSLATRISYTEQDIEDAYTYLKQAISNDKVAESFGFTDQEFKERVIEPELIHTKMRVWFASQKDLNKDAYAKLEAVQKDLSEGKTFEETASKYSDDTLNAKVGGDMGFVGLKDVPPEYYAELTKITDTEVHITVSRHGIHVFKVLGKDSAGPEKTTRYHVQQIFIRASEYSTWFEEQKKQFRVIRFI